MPDRLEPAYWLLGVLAVVSAVTCVALPCVVFWLAFF